MRHTHDEDTYFRRNIEQCRKLGIDFGCYWYVTATDTAELDRQINACIKTIGDEKPSYPVFCDMEEQRQIDNLTSKERTDMALEFCDRLNKAGLPSGVYANPAWLESYYQKERIVGKRDIWLAHWTESRTMQADTITGRKCGSGVLTVSQARTLTGIFALWIILR